MSSTFRYELMSRRSLTPTRRRLRPERAAWNVGAMILAASDRPELAEVTLFDDEFTSRPYLLAHPEREIAAAGTHIGVAYCAACDITYKAPWADVDGVGRRMAAALRFVERHNALIHPRRAARLTK